MKKAGCLFVSVCLAVNVLIAGAPSWSVNPSSFTYSMNVTTKLNVECVDLEDASDLVGAFVGGVCRGVTNASNVVNGNYLAFLTVYSNTASGETVEFKIYDTSEDSIFDVATEVVFQDGAAFGFPTSPFTVYTNNQPTDITISNSAVDENTSNAFVGTLTTADPDMQTHSYTLVSGTGDEDNGSFSISNDSVFVTVTLDYENKTSYSIRIETNDGGCTYQEAFSIAVNDLNDPPTDINLSNNSVNENESIGSSIGSFSTIDVDQSDTHTYLLVAGSGDQDNSNVTLSTSGALTTKIIHDHESKDTLFIRVQSTDAGSNSIEKAFIVLINDVNDIPTNLEMSTYDFYENQNVGTTVASYSTTDQDATDMHQYTFVTTQGSDNASFTIVGNTVRSNAAFDYETKNIYYTYVETNDGNGGTYNKQLIINILDTNDAPTDIAITNLTIAENLSTGTFIGKLSSTDQDLSNAHAYSLVPGTGSTNNGDFLISNDSLFTNAVFNFESKTSYDIRIQTNDGLATFQKEFDVIISDANDAPTNIFLADNEIAENQNSSTVVTSLSSDDADANDTHTYQLVAGTGDDDNDKFKISGSDLQTTTKLDFETEDTLFIRLQTTDSEGLTFQKQFTILVTDENDTPTDIILSTDTFNENVALGTNLLTLSSTDQDNGDSHTYSFDNSQSNDNASFTIVGNTLKANAAFDHESKDIYVVRIQTQDAFSATFIKQFILNVADINDAPTALEITNASIFESAPIGSYIGSFITTDEDAIDTHSYSLVAGNNSTDNASFTISNDSLFTNTTFNYHLKNKYNIRAKTTDQGSSGFEETFIIFIKNSNDAPTDISLDNSDIDENLSEGTVIGTLSTTDVDSGDGHTYSLIAGMGDADNASFEIINDQIVSNASFDFETKDSFFVRIETRDFADSTFEEAFIIQINDANDVPTDISLSTDTFSENQSLGTAIIDISTTDQDTGDNHFYQFDNTQTNDNNLFTIIGNEIRTNASFNYEVKNLYIIYIMTNDGNGGTYTKQFVLHVRDENDSPSSQTLSNNTVDENNTGVMFVGLFSTTDEDVNDAFTYSLVSGTGSTDNSSFTISNDSLFVSDTLDYEVKNQYSILVRSTDQGSEHIDQQYTINVNNTNDAPTDIAITLSEVDENNVKQQIVGSLTTTDEDDNSAHSYSLVTGTGDSDNNSFFIDSESLKINVTTDFETKNTYTIRIQANDGEGGVFEKPFTVSIIDVNERPTIRDTSFEISESTAVNSIVGTLGYADEDISDSHTFSILENDAYEIDGDDLTLGATLDHETQEIYELSVVIKDAGGLSDTATITVRIKDEIEEDLPLPVNKVLSPNHDGRNDFFVIDNVEIYKDYKLYIFNNAGQIIYEALENYDNTWDGTFEGKLVEEGVYYYLLQNNLDESKYFKGSLSVIR